MQVEVEDNGGSCHHLPGINGLATGMKLTDDFNVQTLELAEKFDHPVSPLLIFVNIFAQGHCFDAVTVTGSKYFVSRYELE